MTKVEIPKEVPKEIQKIIAPIIEEINAGGLIVDTSGSDDSTYGHAMRGLVQGVYAHTLESHEKQLKSLKEQAQKLLLKFGPKIIDKMSNEMRQALELDEFKDNFS